MPLVSCSAVLTGVRSFAAIGQRASHAPQETLARLGARAATVFSVRIAPSAAAVRRVLNAACPGGLAAPRRRPKLTFEHQAWAAVLDQRGILRSSIAHLLHLSEPYIRTVLTAIEPLPEQHGHTSERLTVRMVDPSDHADYRMSMTSKPS
ncbi:hypothetical protein [Streptomyces sp. NPDC051286]|uniref:hypothetical protein n=1 Tax=Streptomyces sp. NPDC051286 TaxID=3365647 RepID=UPI0037961BB1